jgi:ABC-2 type transport system ATP-binding protein
MLSTHIMQEVEAICDKVIIISKGQIVANDDTRNLRRSGTRQLITVEFDQEVRKEDLLGIQGVQSAVEAGTNTWQLLSTATEDVRKEVFNFAVQRQIGVLTLNKDEQKMEDVFKELTKN